MTRIGFDNGREEFLALENSRNELASARQALLNEELMYKNTILDLAFAINVDVSDLEKLNLTNP
jgi:outer membrane protein TolC